MYKAETIKKYVKLMNAEIKHFNAIPIDELKTSISYGNRKIGKVMNVSTAAIITCNNCGECSKYCYDLKAALLHTNSVTPARAKNTSIVFRNRDKFFDDIDKAMNRRRKNKFFRFHVSGEILDLDYFFRMVEIARKHSDFIIWTYTKNYAVVNAYCEKYGKDSIPKNFTIMFSEWDGMPLVNPFEFPIFTVKLESGNKNHDESFFNSLYKCPSNCDICKACKRGCVNHESVYADEH